MSDPTTVPRWPPLSLWTGLALLTALRIVAATYTGLTEDETYYRLWALAPSYGYLDHSPMVAWWMAAGKAIAGDTAFGLRVLGPLAVLVGSLALWRMTALLYGERVATWATWLFNAMVLIAAGAVVLTPDAPSVLFWGLAVWAAVEASVRDRPRWWLLVGLFAGLGLLSKYSVLFLGAGLVLYLIGTRHGRRALATPWPWLGGALAVALFAPVLIWNWQFEWASFIKQFGRTERLEGFDPRFVGEITLATIGLLTPPIAILAAVGLAKAVRARDGLQVLLPLSIAPLIVYALYHGLYERVQPNWLGPIYPAAATFAAIALVSLRDRASRWGEIVGGMALPLGYALTALLYLHAAFGLFVLPGTRDPLNQTRGWNDLVSQIRPLMAQHGAVWVATTNYATLGPLAHAGRDLTVVQIDERIRYRHLPEPDAALLRQPGLYIELSRRDRSVDLDERFRSIQPITTLERQWRGTVLARYVVYRIADPIAPPIDPTPQPRPLWP